MRDFTLSIYERLLNTILKQGYTIITFSEYLQSSDDMKKVVILKHDVDKKPHNAFKLARIENSLGIKASYYFRILKISYDETVIREIVKQGHEIGYHYEDLALAQGDYKQASVSFENNLNKLRQFYPVKTVCMHGSPLSKWDNRFLWQEYNYRDFGIIGDPYFDIDFNRVLYLTDTGRRWNGHSFSIRDKVESKYKYNLKSTKDIIVAFTNNELPDQIMINVHPQRWDDNMFLWIKELICQNFKNIGKLLLQKLK